MFADIREAAGRELREVRLLSAVQYCSASDLPELLCLRANMTGREGR